MKLAAILAFIAISINSYAIEKPDVLLDSIVHEINQRREARIQEFLNDASRRLQGENDMVRKLNGDKNYLFVNLRIRGDHILIYCLKNQMWKASEALIRAGSDLNVRDALGKVPIMHAAEKKRESVVKLLLEYNADRSAIDNHGKSVDDYLKANGMDKL